MRFELNGHQVFASTGGREHQSGRDWIIFVHGAGGSHLIWSQQVRAFAYEGYNVLAPDFPAHGNSAGAAFNSPQAMGEWLVAMMDQLNIDQAHLVNHSLGGLACLEIAANNPERVKSIAFIGSAMAISVNDALIETAKDDPPKAYQMMHSGFFSRCGQMHDNCVPGNSLIGTGMQIMARNQPEALAADLAACATYSHGAQAAAKIFCPTLCLLAGEDRMVGLKYGKKLCQTLADCHSHIFAKAGHMITGERPREINQQLRLFYANRF